MRLLIFFLVPACVSKQITKEEITGDADTDTDTDSDQVLPTGDTGVFDAPPDAPVLELDELGLKTFNFTWTQPANTTRFELYEQPNQDTPLEDATQVAVLEATDSTYVHEVPLFARTEARYALDACNNAGCTRSAPVDVPADLVPAIGYIKASNAGESDRFGAAVALSADGSTLAVGATVEDSGIPGKPDDDTEPGAGAVYVFVKDEAGSWREEAWLKDDTPEGPENFGSSVALSNDGNTLVVGVPRDDNPVSNAGSAYVFRRLSGKWQRADHFQASDPQAEAEFGTSVAIDGDGNRVAIGALREDFANTTSGAVYVFLRNPLDERWNEEQKLKANPVVGSAQFGRAVSLNDAGDVLAVGVPRQPSTVSGSGAVIFFERTGSKWTQDVTLANPFPTQDDIFGQSLALDAAGDTIVVGSEDEDGDGSAPGNDDLNNPGAAYVFGKGAGVWQQVAYLKAPFPENGEAFGDAVAINAAGTRVAVSAPGDDTAIAGFPIPPKLREGANDSGAVYMFERIGGEWTRQTYVKAFNPGAFFRFGNDALAISDDGDTLAVGAESEDGSATGIGGTPDTKVNMAGAAYLY